MNLRKPILLAVTPEMSLQTLISEGPKSKHMTEKATETSPSTGLALKSSLNK